MILHDFQFFLLHIIQVIAQALLMNRGEIKLIAAGSLKRRSSMSWISACSRPLSERSRRRPWASKIA